MIHFVLADAGDDISIALPVTRAVLNGTKSKDDIKIVLYHWEQIRYDISNSFHSRIVHSVCFKLLYYHIVYVTVDLITRNSPQ